MSNRLQVAGLVVLGLWLRLDELGEPSAWIDEIHRLTWARGYALCDVLGSGASQTGARLPFKSLAETVSLIWSADPPLNGILLALWFRLVGDSPDALARLPMALLSTASIFVTYIALRERISHRAALIAAALVALSPFHVHYAQEANHYALGYLLCASSFFAFFRFERAYALGAGLFWALVCVLAFCAHYYAAIVILWQFVALVAGCADEPRKLRALVLPVVAGVVAGFPFLRQLVLQYHGFSSVGGAFAGSAFYLHRIVVNSAMIFLDDQAERAPRVAVHALLVCLVLLAGWGVFRANKRDRGWLVSGVLGPLLSVTLAYFFLRSNSILWPRYQLFFSFALFAGLGIALDSLRVPGALLFALLTLCLSLGLVAHRGEVREEWKPLAEIISRDRRQEPVLVYKDKLVYSLARYLRTDNAIFSLFVNDALEHTLESIVRRSDAASGLWLATAWSDSAEDRAKIVGALQSRYARCEPESVLPGLYGLSLLHCEHRRAPNEPPQVVSDPWRSARLGPQREIGFVDVHAGALVTGWVFSTAGIAKVFVASGRRVLASVKHPGIVRPDVADAFGAFPRDLTLRSGFEVPIDPSEPAPWTIFAVRADGSSFILQ